MRRSLRAATKTTRSTLSITLVLGFASAASDAIAAEPAGKTPTRAAAPSIEPGSDGWYGASPPDASFRIRMPAVFQTSAKDDTTDAGVATHSDGVRANVTAAFGGQTNYLASCIEQKNDGRTAKERLQAVIDRWSRLGRMCYRSQIGADIEKYLGSFVPARRCAALC